ncbi:MAG: NADH-dependent [FeFe] hydrogenase, group A6 [Bacillota bacterium]|nr:NADH-dependent [FeFe] hydrogenase, group A6 [Bacillota bacterium]HHU61487.1 4Fe-4S dicluster domain-containing protein [Natronincola sp.]
MSWLLVNGQSVVLNGEKSVLDVVRKAGVDLPTLCYHPELTIHGACRLCMVEIKNRGIVAACHTPPEPGMVVSTHSAILRRVRKMALELLLARHDRECTSCSRSGHCSLQDMSSRYGISDVRFKQDQEDHLPIDDSSIIIRDPNKCILCGECVRICDEVQGIGVFGFVNRGAKMQVTTAFNQDLKETDCVHCGQCAAICPTGALVIKPQIGEAWEAISDPDKTVVVQIAPAVRVSIGEEFNLPPGESTMGQLITALRTLGVSKVFDTGFTADITVLEETEEFFERISSGEDLPQFTSCCPAWVKFAEQYYPEFLNNLSSCRSPQGMLGALVKKLYAKEQGKKPEDFYVISIMPCTAKKFEAAREELTTDGIPDVDLVLTTQELAHMIKEAGINYADLPSTPPDNPFGFVTGAGIIFGVTGGVSEAVLRLGYEKLTNKELEDVVFSEVRGYEGLRSCEIKIEDRTISLAVVHGLANAKSLLEEIKAGKAHFDLVEVMACPGGCIGGGGQPITNVDSNIRERRGAGLYRDDRTGGLQKSSHNPAVVKIYEKWLGEPGSDVAHEVLHTTYKERVSICKTTGVTTGKV